MIAAALQSQPARGTRGFIARFTLRRVLLGASLFGCFAAVESVAQALGIVAAYPNAAQRAKVVYGLASNAALGLFYGDRHANIISPAGYMVYRISPILALVGAIWALSFITKMLRGQEENGRWELLLTGRDSASSATIKTLGGALAGIAIAYVVVSVVLIAVGHNNKFNLSVRGALFYDLALVAGAVVALGIGAITSQLAATRRRAMLYGLVVIIGFFVLRSVGNVADSLVWLKNLTPFGWIDKLHPFYHSQPIWLLPLAGLAVLCMAMAVHLAAGRDTGESLIADLATAKPKFGLLGTQLGFDFRATRGTLSGWLFAGVALAAVIAAIDKTVAHSLAGTGSLSRTFGKLSGNPYARIELAYLGAGAYLIVTVLMMMVTSGLSAARNEEADGRLDNLISGSVSRSYWLAMRLVLLLLAAAGIALAADAVMWALARTQGVAVAFNSLVFGGLSILGPVVFLLGAGVLLYGFKPRLAAAAMYVIVGWSFTIDIIASALKTSKYLADTSLLHHIALVPAASPKWPAFGVLTAIGLAMMTVGIIAFRTRDIEAE